MSTISELSQRVAEDFGAQLEASLPRLGEAMEQGQASASVSVTVQVLKAKKGRMKLKVSPRERIPLEPIEYDVHLDDGQLRLGLDPAEANGGGALDPGEGDEAAAPLQ